MISVVVPTFNRPRLLARALASVRAQDLADWEAVVADDGDGSGLELALSFGDERVRGLRSYGGGQAVARALAVEGALGETVALLDDDDWWEDRGHLRALEAALRAGPALAYRAGWLVRERDGRELERVPFDLEATAETLRRDNTLLASAVAYPRDAHGRLGAFDASLDDYWDWDWWLRLARAGWLPRRAPGRGVCVSVREDNSSSDAHAARRRANLRKLAAKHGLGAVPLRNHLGLVRPAG